jgi:hypothetical protein
MAGLAYLDGNTMVSIMSVMSTEMLFSGCNVSSLVLNTMEVEQMCRQVDRFDRESN